MECSKHSIVMASQSSLQYLNLMRGAEEEEFIFNNVPERPVPSLLRGYSAPIRLDSDLTESNLFFLLANDSDEFNRWEAGQVLARKLILSFVADFQQQKMLALNPKFVDGLRTILRNTSLDKEFIARAINITWSRGDYGYDASCRSRCSPCCPYLC